MIGSLHALLDRKEQPPAVGKHRVRVRRELLAAHRAHLLLQAQRAILLDARRVEAVLAREGAEGGGALEGVEADRAFILLSCP